MNDSAFYSRLREGFDYFDKDKNGTISKEELGPLLKWIDLETASSQIDKVVCTILFLLTFFNIHC